jgi:hypothetical protein
MGRCLVALRSDYDAGKGPVVKTYLKRSTIVQSKARSTFAIESNPGLSFCSFICFPETFIHVQRSFQNAS